MTEGKDAAANAPDNILEPQAMGKSLERMDGAAKVTGAALYAFEHRLERPVYVHLVQATVGRGRISGIDAGAAQSLAGVVAVLTHETAAKLASDENKELWVLQSDEVRFRGEVVAAVLAQSPEVAAQAADLV